VICCHALELAVTLLATGCAQRKVSAAAMAELMQLASVFEHEMFSFAAERCAAIWYVMSPDVEFWRILTTWLFRYVVQPRVNELEQIAVG
jgi:hypothetical protein